MSTDASLILPNERFANVQQMRHYYTLKRFANLQPKLCQHSALLFYLMNVLQLSTTYCVIIHYIMNVLPNNPYMSTGAPF